MSVAAQDTIDVAKAKAEVAKADAEQAARESKLAAETAKNAGNDQSAFVEHQSTLAHARLQEAFRQIGQHLGAVADPRLATKTHPWASLLVAAGTGLVTGIVARKAVHAATTTAPPDPQPHFVVIPEGYQAVSAVDGSVVEPAKAVAAATEKKPSWWSGTALTLVKAAAEAVKPLILAQMSAHAAGVAAEKATDGVQDAPEQPS